MIQPAAVIDEATQDGHHRVPGGQHVAAMLMLVRETSSHCLAAWTSTASPT